MVTGQGGAGMVSREERQIAQALENLLGAASPNFTTYTSLHDVVQQLESKLGFQVSHKIDFIRSHIQYLLRPPQPPPPQLYHPHKDHFALQQLPIARPAPNHQQQSFAIHRPSHELSFRPHLQSQQLQFGAYAAAAAAAVSPTSAAASAVTSTTSAAAPGLAPPQSSKKRSFFVFPLFFINSR